MNVSLRVMLETDVSNMPHVRFDFLPLFSQNNNSLHQIHYCTITTSCVWLSGCVLDTLLGAFPVVSTWGQSCCKNSATGRNKADVRASRWVEREWHFWMALRKLSLLISLHSTQHTAHITHPMWVGVEGNPSMADKVNKSADWVLGKKWRWPGRFFSEPAILSSLNMTVQRTTWHPYLSMLLKVLQGGGNSDGSEPETNSVPHVQKGSLR